MTSLVSPASIERRAREPSQLSRRQTIAGYLFSLPAIVLYTIFVLAPVAVTVALSFANFDPLRGSSWVGLDNYTRFFTNGRSLQIFWNTLRFALFAVTFNVTVGLLLALALDRAMPRAVLYFARLAFFLPVVIPVAFVAIVWGYFYADNFGVFNYYLGLLGLPRVQWLNSAGNAMTSVLIMDVWKNAGFFMIIFVAALQGVPRSLIDAAVMDGAGYWRRFFRIVLPYISPVVFFCVVYASIGALQVYKSITILTRGGPGDATRSMTIHVAEEAFGAYRIGYAAAVSVVLTAVILLITSLQLIASRRLVKT